jgi:hypothetical protein
MALDPGTRMHSGAEINTLVISPPVVIATPLTGATITTAAADRVLYVNPAGTIAALTLLLPPAPSAGQTFQLSFSQIVTALTVQDGAGNAVQSTAGAVSTGIEYRFVSGAWVRWR